MHVMAAQMGFAGFAHICKCRLQSCALFTAGQAPHRGACSHAISPVPHSTYAEGCHTTGWHALNVSIRMAAPVWRGTSKKGAAVTHSHTCVAQLVTPRLSGLRLRCVVPPQQQLPQYNTNTAQKYTHAHMRLGASHETAITGAQGPQHPLQKHPPPPPQHTTLPPPRPTPHPIVQSHSSH